MPAAPARKAPARAGAKPGTKSGTKTTGVRSGSNSVRPGSKRMTTKRSTDMMRRGSTPALVELTLEDQLSRACDALMGAKYILVGAGAGFSADSGLPTYDGIADVPAYKRMGLSYADICDPEWIQKDSGLFFGFWGTCYNAYQDTQPHEGYHILRELGDTLDEAREEAEAYKREREDAQRAQERAEREKADAKGLKVTTTSLSKPKAKAKAKAPSASLPSLFVYTSNVDGHFHTAGFPQGSVVEFHGSCMDWQCARPCKQKIWRLPNSFRFPVNKVSMRVQVVSIGMYLIPSLVNVPDSALPALRLFLETLETHYAPSSVVPYHNRAHAAGTLQFIHSLLRTLATPLSEGTSTEYNFGFTNKEILVALLAAVSHDVGHTGEDSRLASLILHSDPNKGEREGEGEGVQSDLDLEAMHAMLGWGLIVRTGLDTALDLDPFVDRGLFTRLILGTCLSRHGRAVDALQGMADRAKGGDKCLSRSDREALLSACLGL
ncbi:sirtuin family protein, partial [Kipferlia bialata]|eukprot:g6234.t1